MPLVLLWVVQCSIVISQQDGPQTPGAPWSFHLLPISLGCLQDFFPQSKEMHLEELLRLYPDSGVGDSDRP